MHPSPSKEMAASRQSINHHHLQKYDTSPESVIKKKRTSQVEEFVKF